MPIAKVQMPNGKIGRFEVPEGTTPEQVIEFANNQENDSWKQTVSEYAHGLLPGVGAAVGGAIGLASPMPGGLVAGGLGGGAIGEQLADIGDDLLGVSEPRTMGETVKQAAGNVGDAAMAEAIGLGIPAVGGAVWRGGKSAVNSVMPKAFAEKRLAELFGKYRQTGDAGALEEFKALQREIEGLEGTTGMQTRNKGLISEERAVLNSEGKAEGLEGASRRLETLDTGNRQALSNTLDDVAPGSAADLQTEMARQVSTADASRAAGAQIDRAVTGSSARGAIDEAAAPAEAEMKRLEGMIPDYPMQFKTTRKAIAVAKKDRALSDDQRAVLEEVEKKINKLAQRGETTLSGVGFGRTLNDLISKHTSSAGSDSAVPLLMRIKDGVKADFERVGSLARTGKLKEFDGKAVNVDDLGSQLARNRAEMDGLTGAKELDLKEIQKRLGPSSVRVVGETAESHAKRIANDYSRRFKTDPPTIAKGTDKLADLTKQSDEIERVLYGATEGKDAAKAVSDYNSFAENAYFNRFKNPQSIKSATNSNTAIENVTNRFAATPRTARELITAVGKDEAKRLMRAHYLSDLSGQTSDAALNKWVTKNIGQLKQFGLAKEMIAKAKELRGYQHIQKIAGGDTETLFKTIIGGNQHQQRAALAPILKRIKGNHQAQAGLKRAFIEQMQGQLFKKAGGKDTFGNAAKLMKDMKPTINALFTKQERAKLDAVKRGIEFHQQLLQGNALGNSHTAELLGKKLVDGRKQSPLANLISAPMLVVGGALQNPALIGLGSVGWVTNLARKHGDKALRQMFVRAAFDPDLAANYIRAAKTSGRDKEAVNFLAQQLTRAAAY